MGLFTGKQKQPVKKDAPFDEMSDGVQSFFDNYFSDLRDRGRLKFNDLIDEKVGQFNEDLTKAIGTVNTDLKQYALRRLDAQLNAYTAAMQDAQNEALNSLKNSAGELKGQYEQLRETLQDNIASQENTLRTVLDENSARIEAMKAAQDSALETLSQSAQALQEEHLKLRTALQESIEKEKTALVGVFEANMAQIIERYLLEALGDQFDLKAQLPAILKQMEENKQAMVDDMKL